eukprot:1217171-Amphidinium_carterae.1
MVDSFDVQNGCLRFGCVCHDLVKAYRQVPLRASQQRLSIFAQWRARIGGPVFSEQRAQSFGASAAALNFHCQGLALAALLDEVLEVPTAEYFDDYGTVMPSLALDVFTNYFDDFMGLLGWQFASKAPPSE